MQAVFGGHGGGNTACKATQNACTNAYTSAARAGFVRSQCVLFGTPIVVRGEIHVHAVVEPPIWWNTSLEIQCTSA
ncbi:hypothetical protein OG871_03545 [Kitasatospora sp. NBC_00374]|uniref:hypothetical protein n=1 Tax=Kitasatospora sp. NBC_00374 TaxID=2975964 RepID=UPI0030E2A605